MAVAVLFGTTALACVVSAHEDEGEPLIITLPSGDEPISCAVFYADNMVYAPQWRIGNYVRLEAMVLDMTDYDSAKDLTTTDTDLYPDPEVPDPNLPYLDGLEQQAAIIADSATVLPMTRMVSVSYIQMSITGPGYNDDNPYVLEAGWDIETGESISVNGLGREVNKAGHLIYGCLWDTYGFETGFYTVTTRLGVLADGVVTIGDAYSVDYAICHLYIGEGEYVDPEHPYADLAASGDDPIYQVYKNGLGNCTSDGGGAWVELGQLIPQGSGGGNGGDSGNGGEGGNGNGQCGAGGNCNGGSKSRSK